MREISLVSLMSLLLTVCCLAAPPTLRLPDTVDVPLFAFGELKADGDFEFIKWKLPKGLRFRGADGRELLFAGPPGVYVFEAVASNKEGITDFVSARVVIGDGKPTPGPAPTPDIKPDNPPTPPKDIPLPGGGLRVLIIYESKDLSTYPATQLSVMHGKTVRDWLDQNCVAGAGNRREWNIWDADQDATAMGKIWVDAMKRKRDSLPWLIASNGRQAIEIPLPKTPQEFLEKVGALK